MLGDIDIVEWPGLHVVNSLQLVVWIRVQCRFWIQSHWGGYLSSTLPTIGQIGVPYPLPSSLMGTSWPVSNKCEKLVLLVLISIFTLNSTHRFDLEFLRLLVVWDIKTGVVILEAKTDHCGKILFYGDQKIAILVERGVQSFYIYDVSNRTLLFQGGSVSQHGTGFGAHWTHEGTLHFATSFERNGKFMINIYKFQPTSIPPLHKLSSFPVPPQEGNFSFSPVSFHASFVTNTKVVILDVQNSKLLLHSEDVQVHNAGQFSPNGCFFACKISMLKIYVWQNTPTGYVPWRTFTSRLPVLAFLWSPTSDLFLCHCGEEMVLLHPDRHFDPLSSDENKPNYWPESYSVVHPTDHPYIGIAQQRNGIVTILDSLSATIQWVINTGMEIYDIKMIDNTVYVVDMHKLVSWHFGAGGVVPGVSEALDFGADAQSRALSHDCTQVAFVREGVVFLYDVKAQKILKSFKGGGSRPYRIRFSPDGHQLLCVHLNPLMDGECVKLDITEDWSSMEVTSEHIKGYLSWYNLFSSGGYYVGMEMKWVINSGDNKILWLPPHWRRRVRWEGNYLALVDHLHPIPIIIEFQL